MHSLNLAAFLLAASSLGKSYADSFECKPTTVDDSKTTNELQCRLSTAPAKPVKVHFNSHSFRFGSCSLTLTDNQWKTVPLNVVPVCSDKETSAVNIDVRLFSEDCEVQNRNVTVQRKFAKCAVGTSVGDPHFKTFNDFSYTSMGEGTFDLISHPQFQVQAVQGKCFAKATCNHALSIRYGNSIMALDLRTDAKMKQVTANVDGIEYSAPEAKDPVHSVSLPCGSKIVITTANNTVDKWMNVNLILAASYKNYGGLLNRADLPKDSFVQRGGNIIKDSKVFIDSWKVAPTDYNMDKKFVKFTPVTVPGLKCTLPDTCKVEVKPVAAPPPLPSYVAPPPKTTTVTKTVTTSAVKPTSSAVATSVAPVLTSVGTTTGVKTTTVVSTVSVPVGFTSTSVAPITQPTPPPPPSEFISDVTKHCNEIMTVKGCNEVISPASAIENCIADCSILKNFAMAESHRQSYMAECKALVDLMNDDPVEVVAANAKEIEKNSGLKENSCPKDCSGKGKCTVNGCTCDAGFSGMDCSTNLAALIAYDQKKNAYVVNNPVKDVFPVNPVDNIAPVAGMAPTVNNTMVNATEYMPPFFSSAKGYTVGSAILAALIML